MPIPPNGSPISRLSSLAVIEGVAVFITVWIPMYYAVKTCFIIWLLLHPKTLVLTQVIYNQVVRSLCAATIEMGKLTKRQRSIRHCFMNKGNCNQGHRYLPRKYILRNVE
jgi:hypothetical protein